MATPLQPGEQRTFLVDSRDPFFRTGILLAEGTTYKFSVPPAEWHDYNCPPTGPEGSAAPHLFMSWFDGLRQAPKFNWMALIGTIDDDHEATFNIINDLNYNCPKSGELCCFANDVNFPIFYWNNTGSMSVVVSLLHSK
jgi:hypothetical protein